MNVFFTLSTVVRVAFWALILGIVLGLALGLLGGRTQPDRPGPVDVLLFPAPVSPVDEGRW